MYFIRNETVREIIYEFVASITLPLSVFLFVIYS